MAQAAPPREQLVNLIVGMLAKKGPTMATEILRRIKAREPLVVKGITMEVDALEDALLKYGQKENVSRSAINSALSVGLPPSSYLPKPGSSARIPSSESKSRWNPGLASASLLSSRALMECENAEVMNIKARVVRGASAVVFKKPDVFSQTTGEILADGEVIETVARFISQRDGRVYFRLRKEQSSWVSTRCPKLLTQVVLEPLDGESVLEPPQCSEPLISKSLTLLPTLDPKKLLPSRLPVAPPPEIEDAAIGDAGEALDEDDFDEDYEGRCGKELDVEAGDSDGEEDEEMGEADFDDREETNEAYRKLAPISCAIAKTRTARPRKFRVVVGRCPVLSAPHATELMASGAKVMLNMKQEFWADAAVFMPSEGRTYVRLRKGHGWVSERSRTDLRRFAILPCVKRKKPLSKKMAKSVAFRGGDAEGVTRLRPEDLVKNSQGKIVSKRASEAAKKRYKAGGASKWTDAVKKAKEALGMGGFVAVKKGTPVYEKARAYYLEETVGKK